MSLPKNILIVEDEADLAELIRYNLEHEGYAAQVAPDGKTALALIRQNPPDLVLLDRMLPGMTGDEILTRMKREPQTTTIPVIMLTAKAEESDELIGLALGADDYITKPCSMKLLLARVAAMFRRFETNHEQQEVLVHGPFRLDTTRYELTVQDQSITLTATEFKLLKSLMLANGRVLSRVQLIDAAMGTDTVVTDRTIDVHVAALRKKLGDHAGWIQTIRGIGYTFRPND